MNLKQNPEDKWKNNQQWSNASSVSVHAIVEIAMVRT